MAERVTVSLDPEADFLEVTFSDAPGFMRETANDAIIERVDTEGKIIGIGLASITNMMNC